MNLMSHIVSVAIQFTARSAAAALKGWKNKTKTVDCWTSNFIDFACTRLPSHLICLDACEKKNELELDGAYPIHLAIQPNLPGIYQT